MAKYGETNLATASRELPEEFGLDYTEKAARHMTTVAETLT